MRVAVLLAAVAALWVQPASAAVTLNLQVNGVIPYTDTKDYGTDFSNPGCVDYFGSCHVVTTGLEYVNNLLPSYSSDGVIFDFSKPGMSQEGLVSGSAKYLGAGIYQPLSLSFSFFQSVGGPGGHSEVVSGTGSFSVFDPLNPPLPEPSTWALMLFGFGAVGFGMRRRPQFRSTPARP